MLAHLKFFIVQISITIVAVVFLSGSLNTSMASANEETLGDIPWYSPSPGWCPRGPGGTTGVHQALPLPSATRPNTWPVVA